MNINRRGLLQDLLEIIRWISDKTYQERVWVRGEGPEICDFDDTVCEFFLRADIIIDHYKDYGLTESQYQQLFEFRKEFRNFCDGPAIEFYMPFCFIDRPEWAHVIKMAQHILAELKIDEITPRMVSEYDIN